MRKTLTITLTVLVLAMPAANVWAAATTPRTAFKKIVVAKKTFSGSVVQADRWGPVQVTIVVKKTTTTAGTKKTVKRHIESINVPVYPDHTGRSQFISQNALPAPHAGGAQGAEHPHLHHLGRDLHERGVRSVAAGRDHEGEGLVTVVLPGVAARRACDGDADPHRHSRRRCRRARFWTRPSGPFAPWTIASAPTGTTARSCASTAASSPSRMRTPMCASSLRAATNFEARPGGSSTHVLPMGRPSIHPASSRAGRSTASLRSSPVRVCATSS